MLFTVFPSAERSITRSTAWGSARLWATGLYPWVSVSSTSTVFKVLSVIAASSVILDCCAPLFPVEPCGHFKHGSQEFEFLVKPLDGSEGRQVFLLIQVLDHFGKAKRNCLAFIERHLHQRFGALRSLELIHLPPFQISPFRFPAKPQVS